MRRVLLALSGLAAGTTLLISLKSAPGAARLPSEVAAANAAAHAPATPAASPAPTGPSVPIPGPPPLTPTPAAGASGGPKTSGPPATKPTATTKPPTTPASGAPAVIVGDSSVTEFGYVTVGITVSGGRITDVIAQELPGDEPRSIAISNRAAPILRSRALAAQGTGFDTVSGATWTSQAYKESLHSAMQKAGLA